MRDFAEFCVEVLDSSYYRGYCLDSLLRVYFDFGISLRSGDVRRTKAVITLCVISCTIITLCP